MFLLSNVAGDLLGEPCGHDLPDCGDEALGERGGQYRTLRQPHLLAGQARSPNIQRIFYYMFFF